MREENRKTYDSSRKCDQPNMSLMQPPYKIFPLICSNKVSLMTILLAGTLNERALTFYGRDPLVCNILCLTLIDVPDRHPCNNARLTVHSFGFINVSRAFPLYERKLKILEKTGRVSIDACALVGITPFYVSMG